MADRARSPASTDQPFRGNSMISCNQYDYLEIACLYRIGVCLTLKDGSEISGVPVKTGFNEHKQECLEVETGGDALWVPTDMILTMQALTENPHFTKIEFEQ
ncbi:TPA: transcriptional antiterminator [Vibrio vulnificus]|nr:transcriptional antiterminator [Vibrio vulnificus]